MPNEHERQEAIDPTQRQLPNRERVKSDAAEVLGKAKEAGQQHLEWNPTAFLLGSVAISRDALIGRM